MRAPCPCGRIFLHLHKTPIFRCITQHKNA
nr:MAG TPA: hypothetical protein [Caudoviricetes sp.]